jgi:hypothetical protein
MVKNDLNLLIRRAQAVSSKRLGGMNEFDRLWECKFRQEFPGALIVGNSSESWLGPNGEMNEGRPAQLESHIRSSARHTSPTMNMYQTILKNAQDIATVRNDLKKILDLGAFYGAAVDYRHVLWFDEFDDVLKTHSTATR